MTFDSRPTNGFRQPTIGLGRYLHYKAMKGQKKTPKVPGFMRTVVGSNVARLLDHHFSHLPNVTQKQHALAKDSGVGFGTIQRIMKRTVGASLDNLESIADALHVSSYQLMLPALDAKNPQVVEGASEEEQRAYRRWKRGMEDLKLNERLKRGEKHENGSSNRTVHSDRRNS